MKLQTATHNYENNDFTYKSYLNGSKLNSGVYYYTLEADGIATTKKMVLTK